VNERIRISQIRVISADGRQLGIMSPREGREMAREAGLDLVEVAPRARPPVCRIMDYGKFRYDRDRKARESKQKRVETKQIRLRPKTDDHDLQTKMNRAQGFLEKGHPVRFVMRMRGREHAVTDRWVEQLNDLVDDLDGHVVDPPSREGRAITATLEPVAVE